MLRTGQATNVTSSYAEITYAIAAAASVPTNSLLIADPFRGVMQRSRLARCRSAFPRTCGYRNPNLRRRKSSIQPNRYRDHQTRGKPAMLPTIVMPPISPRWNLFPGCDHPAAASRDIVLFRWSTVSVAASARAASVATSTARFPVCAHKRRTQRRRCQVLRGMCHAVAFLRSASPSASLR